MSAHVVLDASALLALVHDEPGAAVVAGHLEGAAISSVNWCEIAERAASVSVELGGLRDDVVAAGMQIVAFADTDAELAASLRPATRAAGLGLADRACLALALRLGVPALTADRAWSQVKVGVEIVAIR